MMATALVTRLKPLLGWTVIGHEWRLRISWKDENGGGMVNYYRQRQYSGAGDAGDAPRSFLLHGRY